MRGIICLDVGGTELKGCAVTPQGELLGEVCHFPARAREAAEPLLAHLAETLKTLGRGLTEILGVGLAFPGPFDYENGVCLLRGLDKFESLYGVNLRRELALRLEIPGERIRFCNDVSAFALGHMRFGVAAAAKKAMFLCIGTGCGSAFGLDGRLVGDEVPGVPAHGYVYPTPFLDGCLDDYLSRRGLMALSRQYLGQALEGRELALAAGGGNQAARDCFAAFGQRLKEGAEPFLRSFRPDCLCLGGQITKSAELFLKPLEALCEQLHVTLYTSPDTSKYALKGLSCL